MTAKFTVLGNTTLATASASVTFSSIPGGYKDLVLVIEVLASGGDLNPLTRLNGDSGSNYSAVSMDGNGSVTGSYSYTDTNIAGVGATTTSRVLNTIDIMDYSATNKHKSVLLRSNRASASAWASALRWANTSAVTSVSVTASANSFAAGSTFRLLGVN
jgi:hypothetical protein